MRAATMIVGAIAAASILIALAFILSGGDSTGKVTKTVTEKIVEAPETGAEEPAAEVTGGEGGAPHASGPSQCGAELSVEEVSCEVGEAIRSAYEEGRRGKLSAAEGGRTVELDCKGEGPVECTNGEGAAVYFGG